MESWESWKVEKSGIMESWEGEYHGKLESRESCGNHLVALLLIRCSHLDLSGVSIVTHADEDLVHTLGPHSALHQITNSDGTNEGALK